MHNGRDTKYLKRHNEFVFITQVRKTRIYEVLRVLQRMYGHLMMQAGQR